jgi:hypothetical protein
MLSNEKLHTTIQPVIQNPITKTHNKPKIHKLPTKTWLKQHWTRISKFQIKTKNNTKIKNPNFLTYPDETGVHIEA